jgi:hypothetical protein
MIRPSLEPMPTPSVTAWRVPMWVEEGDYTVHLSERHIRIYDETTLPDFIKASMSMINAFPFKPMQEGVVWRAAYTHNTDPRQADIGWRCTWNLYMLILSEAQLESMNG